MLFNSFQFITFYIVVVALLFSLPHRWRWIWLLAASAYFYMCWNPAYIVFLLFVIVVDYLCGIGMGRANSDSMRRLLLGVSILNNMGLLFVFKYFNFVSHTLSAVTGASFPMLQLVLPIGLSFHVFQSVAYTIEVYRRRVEPERHALASSRFCALLSAARGGPH